MDSFGWRISVATIAQAGPFSAFAGVDRQITLLDGDGVHLHSADGQINHALDQRWQPFAFSGDVALVCTLLGLGRCRIGQFLVLVAVGKQYDIADAETALS